LSLGAKERGLELIQSKNTKIRRQKYVSPKSKAWHGRATSQDLLLLLLLGF